MPEFSCATCERNFKTLSQLSFHNNSKLHKNKVEGKPIEEPKQKRAYTKKPKVEPIKPSQDEKSKIDKIKNLILSFD